MPPTSATLNGGFKALEHALDPTKFKGRLKANIQRANRLNGVVMVKHIRKVIQAGDFVRNAALTRAIKRSSKPLVDEGSHLFQAITSVAVGENAVFVGVLQRDEFHDIARAIHNGTSIPVTDAMRNLFAVLARASAGEMDPALLTGRAAELWERMPGRIGGGNVRRSADGKFIPRSQWGQFVWKPLSPNTTVIVIPPRPFIAKAFDDQSVRRLITQNWVSAIEAATKPPGK